MRTIWKYDLAVGNQELAIPAGAHLLAIGWQHPTLVLWALIDPTAPAAPRPVAVVGTGWPIAVGLGRHIGTVTVDLDETVFVWHAFEGMA